MSNQVAALWQVASFAIVVGEGTSGSIEKIVLGRALFRASNSRLHIQSYLLETHSRSA